MPRSATLIPNLQPLKPLLNNRITHTTNTISKKRQFIMNENALTNEELMQLESLVDGELPEPQYSQLLSRLDQVNEGWKICALTFLENQAFEKEMRTLTQSALANSLTASLAPAFDLQQESMQTTVLWTRAELPQPVSLNSSSTSVSSNTERLMEITEAPRGTERSFARLFLMLAASIAIAFVGGLLAGKSRNNSSNEFQQNIATNLPAKFDSIDSALDDVEQALAEQIAYEGLDPSQTYNIDPPTDVEQPAGLPVAYNEPLDSSMLESKERKIVRLNSLVDAEMENVQSYVPYTREDGQEIVVPVQNLKFRPIAVHGF